MNSPVSNDGLGSTRIEQLDGIRGIACLLVLTHHYFTGVLNWDIHNSAKLIIDVLGIFLLSGVDLFFVLSGFLVGGIIIDNYHKANFLKVFYIRRVCRIFPVYFLLIFSLPVALYSLSHFDFVAMWLLEKPLPYWSYLTFSQSYLMGLHNVSGPKWAAISWSVSVEEQFYILLPMVIMATGKRAGLIFASLAVVIAPIFRTYFFHNIGFYAGYMFFPGRMDSILWGVLAAYIVRSDAYKNLSIKTMYWLAFILVTFVIFTIAYRLKLIDIGAGDSSFFTLIAIIYAIFILIAFDGRIKFLTYLLKNRFLIFTGALSYSIYMFHQMVNGLIHGYFFSDKPVIDHWEKIGATLISVALVYVLAYFSYIYYEQPIRAWGKRYRYKDQPQKKLTDILIDNVPLEGAAHIKVPSNR